MKIACVFPGQGSQYVGMGKLLYEKYPLARDVFAKASEVLQFDLAKLCFEGPEEDLLPTAVTQPAILTVSIASWGVFNGEGSKALGHLSFSPAVMAGHSLGEYSALVAAGAISFTDAVALVHKRGQFMTEVAPPGGKMAALLGPSVEETQELCRIASGEEGIVEPANFNCPGQVVISGIGPAFANAVELASQYGAKRVVKLAVSGPFHSSLMKPAGEKLDGILSQVPVVSPVVPVMANVSADFVSAPEEIKAFLAKQVSSSVLWQQTVEKMMADGVDTFIEIGPGKVLTGLVRKINKQAVTLNVEDDVTLENTIAYLKEVH